MKNKIILYLIIFLVFTSCVGGISYCAYNYLITSKEEQTETITEDPLSYEALFTEETMPIMDGSTVAGPLLDALYADFMGVELSSITKTYSQTQPSYTKLIDKKVDLIIVTEPSADALKYA